MVVITLGGEGGSSDHKDHERSCMRYCNILGLDNNYNSYIGVFTF